MNWPLIIAHGLTLLVYVPTLPLIKRERKAYAAFLKELDRQHPKYGRSQDLTPEIRWQYANRVLVNAMIAYTALCLALNIVIQLLW